MYRDPTPEPEPPLEAAAAPLVAAVKAVLRPLIRLLIARRVTLPTLKQILKEVYVETAERHYGLDGAPPTDSRVALLTGVHRKDVRSLRAERTGPVEPPRAAPLAATVVGRWLGDPAFSEHGAPRVLPLVAVEGRPSFHALVERVTKDVRPRTVLAELLRLGCVRELANPPRLELVADALLPPPGAGEAIGWFAANAGDHLSAAAANLLRSDGAPAPFLERAVYFRGLSAEQAERLEALARTLATEALAEVNRAANTRRTDAFGADADATLAPTEGAACEDGPRQRFRFGVYVYREPQSAAQDAASEGSDDGTDDGTHGAAARSDPRATPGGA